MNVIYNRSPICYKTTNNHSYSHWQNIILVTQGKQACNSPTLPMTSMFIPSLRFLIHSWHTFTPQKPTCPTSVDRRGACRKSDVGHVDFEVVAGAFL